MKSRMQWLSLLNHFLLNLFNQSCLLKKIICRLPHYAEYPSDYPVCANNGNYANNSKYNTSPPPPFYFFSVTNATR